GYEIALAPVFPRTKRIAGPLTAAVALAVNTDEPPALQGPLVPRTEVDAQADDWVPHLAWVAGGEASYALTMSELADVQVWIAGRTTDTVTLRWQIWRRATGWT